MKNERYYCDLHIHTTYSDGNYSLSEVLKMCEKENLYAISITDHDNIESYFELQNPNIKNIFGGKIINGCEVRCVCNKVPIEILAYGFDINKFKKFLDDYDMNVEKDDIVKAKLLYERFKLIDPDYNYPIEELLQNHEDERIKVIYEDGHKSQKIYAELKKEKNDNNLNFLRTGMNNPSSKFFCDVTGFYISAIETIDKIHECGGLAFLAHPFVYGEDYKSVLEELTDKLDGIECFHPSANLSSKEFLKKYTLKNNLLMSGGSDFHGCKGIINSQKANKDIYHKIISNLNL